MFDTSLLRYTDRTNTSTKDKVVYFISTVIGHLSREPVTSRWSVESRVRQVTASLCPEHTQVAALSLVSSNETKAPIGHREK